MTFKPSFLHNTPVQHTTRTPSRHLITDWSALTDQHAIWTTAAVGPAGVQPATIPQWLPERRRPFVVLLLSLQEVLPPTAMVDAASAAQSPLALLQGPGTISSAHGRHRRPYRGTAYRYYPDTTRWEQCWPSSVRYLVIHCYQAKNV